MLGALVFILFAFTTVIPNSTTAESAAGVTGNESEKCGVMSKAFGLAQGGFDSDREAFPWIVNIFTKYNGVALYAGSGSLISQSHVLCAANSVAYENYLGDESLDLNPEQNYVAYDPKNIRLVFGSNYYKSMKENGSLIIDGTKKVVLHPKVSGTKPRIFNVALIYLKKSIPISKFISPVCLQSHQDEIDVLGKTLFAVGYGVGQSGDITGVKRILPMVVVNEDVCQKFYTETLQKTKSSKFFCARGNGIDTPCRYDKPLYLKIGDRWFIHAMSSVFKIFKNTRACRPRAPVMYEDVSPLTDWIDSEINENNSINDH